MPIMYKRRLLTIAWGLVSCVFAAACGSGGSAGEEPADTPVWITEPTEAQNFATDQPTVRLAGGAFIPSGATCNAPIGTLPPGYVVRWLNEATGATGSATARLHCLLLPTVAWDTADISLVIGLNRLVVSAQSADGRAGSDSLLVERVPDTTPPRVVAIAPPAGAAFVNRETTIEVTFSEPVDEDSLRRGWTVRAGSATTPLAGSIVAAAPAQYVFFPALPLAPLTTYVVRIVDVRDRNGLPMQSEFWSSFTTAP
jgi:hypothetical protein